MTRITILTGGVGGAKLVLGFAELLGGNNVTAIVNTGDDFTHLGLHVSPDLDTLLYTLSGKSDEEKGWGRAGESWQFMAATASLGGEDWFALGDGDLALHVLRTARRNAGETLSEVTSDFAARWNVATQVVPMSDDPVATMIDTNEGELAFQTYFVARRCAPAVRSVRFEGAALSRPAPGVIEAIGDPDIAAIVIAPSNPYLSVDPMFAVPGIREALSAATAPVIAVSPVVNGQSFKGPTAKLMGELGLSVDSGTIADHYAGVIDAMLVDSGDGLDRPGLTVARGDIAMPTLARKVAVAREVLALARRM